MPRFQLNQYKKDGKVVSEKGYVVIPQEIWKAKGWKQGTPLKLTEGTDGTLYLRDRDK
jgi:AbrB family looped-hinge helix DNA binding protein